MANAAPEIVGSSAVPQQSSYHAALVFYPWKNQYPLENMEGNNTTAKPVIYATGSTTISGITSIQYSRRKGIGGSMNVEFTGYIQAEAQLSVGTWCVLHTSHVSPLVTEQEPNKVAPHGIIRFIGQVYEINASYSTDASGRLMRKVIMTIREWCHALHCPIRYHPVSATYNLNQVAVGKALGSDTKKQDAAARSQLMARIGSSMVNVFQQPALSLAWIGAMQKNTDSLLSVLGITTKDVSMFSNVIARLPSLPDKLLEDVFPDKKLTSISAWAEGFMGLLSGVQTWTEAAGDNAFWDKSVEVDAKANRPVAPAALDFLTQSQSLYQMITSQVSGGGGTEVFADMWYGPSNEPLPVLVVRDIPFTLRTSMKGNKFPWTVYDDLPRIPVPLSRIMRLDLKQGIHNTANLIEMSILNGSNVAEVQALKFFGTVVLPESQKRFGAQQRPALQIRDIFTAPEKSKAKGTLEAGTKEGVAENVAKIATAIKNQNVSPYAWFGELSKRQVMWFGADYLFPSCTLTVKDADFPVACGVNVSFASRNGKITYVGHCEGFSQSFVLDQESGRAVSQMSIQLSRLCVVGADKNLAPMTYDMIVNFLQQSTPGTLDIGAAGPVQEMSAEAFEHLGEVKIDAVGKQIQAAYEAKTAADKKNTKGKKDVKVPDAKGTPPTGKPT